MMSRVEKKVALHRGSGTDTAKNTDIRLIDTHLKTPTLYHNRQAVYCKSSFTMLFSGASLNSMEDHTVQYSKDKECRRNSSRFTQR